MIAYTQCYSGLWRLPNIRAVLPLGGISLLHREIEVHSSSTLRPRIIVTPTTGRFVLLFHMLQTVLSNDLITHKDLISSVGKGDFL